MTSDTLLTFPCLFPIKVMGLNNDDLVPEVTAIILSHYNEFNPNTDIQIKPSKTGKYLSITANIVANNQQQIDAIYLQLNQHDLVKITI